jgi:protein-disulfide isomerase
MRIGIALAVLAALPLSSGVAEAKPTPRAAAVRDWTRSVTVTPAGGFRLGNPAAPVKLIEYGSLACPHCRHFEETGYKSLVDRYVRSGRVSYEFRTFLINGPDVSITLLAHCAGPTKFFAMAQSVYATQPQWEAKIENMSDAQKAELDGMSDRQRFIRYAEIAGMVPMAARFGVTPVRARQCLADAKGLQRLLDLTKAARDNGIRHTPTFVINGKMSGSATWDELEPELKAALGGRG